MELRANQQQAMMEQQMILDERTDKQLNNMQSQAQQQYDNLVNAVGGEQYAM